MSEREKEKEPGFGPVSMLVRLQRHVHLWFKYTAALFYRDAAFVLSLRGDHWALELWSQLRSVAVLWNLVKCLQALTAEGSGCEPAKLLVRKSPWIFLPYLCFFLIPLYLFLVSNSWSVGIWNIFCLFALRCTGRTLMIPNWMQPSQVFQDVPVTLERAGTGKSQGADSDP